MKLLEVSCQKPKQLMQMLHELGEGENGFGGTPVATGEMSLDAYLQQCIDRLQRNNLPEGLVPQSIFWILDDQNLTVGMLRLRHYLNDNLLNHGGHIGFYIRPDARGKGYGQFALNQALEILASKGQQRALLTVDIDNKASIAVITKCGGILEDTRVEASTKRSYHRYWINLDQLSASSNA